MHSSSAPKKESSIATSGIDPIYMIEADFVTSQTRHDMTWLQQFIERISDTNYAWPADDRLAP